MMTKQTNQRKNGNLLLKETVLLQEIEPSTNLAKSLQNQLNHPLQLLSRIINPNTRDLSLLSQNPTPTISLARKKKKPPSSPLARTNHSSSQAQKIPTQRKENTLLQQPNIPPDLNTDQDMKTEIVQLQDPTTPTTDNHLRTDPPHHTDHIKDHLHTPETIQETTMVKATTIDLTTTDLPQEIDPNPTLEMTDLAVQMNPTLKRSPFPIRTNPFSSQWLKTII